MKKIMSKIIFITVLFSSALTFSQWDEIVYHYQTGSVPPPYFFSYDLTINSAGTGTLVYSPNYGNDTTWVYNISFTESDLKKLNEVITRSNILNETIPALPDSLKPIGGSLQNVSIQTPQDPSLDQAPPRIVTPYFPEESYKEALTGIYSVIQKMVPDNVWNEINERKEEYNKKNEK
jgi:hypothetical protein